MSEDLPYNTFRYALQDDYGYYDGAPVEQYANSFVERAFENTLAPTLAVEAIVALNIWMAVVHELYAQVKLCRNQANVAVGRSSESSNIVLPVDIAAAYYIGDGQQTGSSEICKTPIGKYPAGNRKKSRKISTKIYLITNPRSI